MAYQVAHDVRECCCIRSKRACDRRDVDRFEFEDVSLQVTTCRELPVDPVAVNPVLDQLTEYERFVGSEFADVRGRITDVEEQTQELEATFQETPTETTDADTDGPSHAPVEKGV